jgi:hypothetical protein
LSSEKGTTVTIIRVGTTQKYAEGWTSAFKGKKSASNGAATKKTATKKAAPKSVATKSVKAPAKKAKAAPKKKAKR